jgi:hypothetical protein
MNQEQRNALFGPSSSFSEHKAGDTIQFRQGNDIKQGKIIHVRAPGPAVVDGKDLPLLYVVDTGHGFPAKVLPSQIIHGSFTAVLGTYGFPDSTLQSREQAENLAVNVQGQIIDTEQGRLRVLSARVEGDGTAGKVLAECESVQDGEEH